jgi:hypothetical protein
MERMTKKLAWSKKVICKLDKGRIEMSGDWHRKTMCIVVSGYMYMLIPVSDFLKSTSHFDWATLVAKGLVC